MFQSQPALESGEAAGEPAIIRIPEGEYFAVRLTLSVANSKTKMWWGRAIVNFAAEPDNQEEAGHALPEGLKERIRRWITSRAGG